MARHKDTEWNLPDRAESWDQVAAAVLMDIRDELKKLNRVFECRNFMDVPHKLERIARNTVKRKRK